ncbi:hypothetical protein DFP72DRAFT_912429 [Ephemerocybe angulata]|uniref:Uncharacterized protein n=1 Tax=Ephemerocybe angulata TaxID=980116 RepID=A0A8H6HNZ4_9AGAR|nr:hypothetical protein DFP72DRAFT_912419 [Tulosesus angulatus]KAF6749699.1 hypothetical protein DFP72DRAFT_912429 [Tulosesus angulatus]
MSPAPVLPSLAHRRRYSKQQVRSQIGGRPAWPCLQTFTSTHAGPRDEANRTSPSVGQCQSARRQASKSGRRILAQGQVSGSSHGGALRRDSHGRPGPGEDPPFNRLTPPHALVNPDCPHTHAQTKCIGRLPTSIKTPIAGTSIVFGAFHTRAAPRATASTGTPRTERNARLWDDTALSGCHPSKRFVSTPLAARSQIPTSGKHTHPRTRK